jgi:predicted nucleic acid-binding protein
MAEVPRIYFDACVIIDMADFEASGKVQGDREQHVLACKSALRAARAGKLRIFTSTLSIPECTGIPKGESKPPAAAKSFLEMLLISGKSGVSLVQQTISISRQARDLRWVHEMNLKGADSIHVASALSMKCSEIWTGDKGISKRPQLTSLGLSPVRPASSRLVSDEFNQDDLPGI